jgi:hypothetical protein
MTKETIARLRRVLSHDGEDVEVSALVERMMLAVASSLPAEYAAMYERILLSHAQAAEEMDEDADPFEIAARARELRARRL